MGVDMDEGDGIGTTFLNMLVRMARKCDHTTGASHFVSFVANLPIRTGEKQKRRASTKVTEHSKKGVDHVDEDMESSFLQKLVEMARRCDNLSDASDFVGLIASLPIKAGGKRHADGADDKVSKAKRRRIEPVCKCDVCGKKISNKANLKRHLLTAHKKEFAEKPKNPNAEKKNAQFEALTSKERANSARITSARGQVKKRAADTPMKALGGGSCVASKNTSNEHTCTLCTEKHVDLYKHYKNHNIDNPEEMLFLHGNALVRSDRDTKNGKAGWFQKQRKKASYNDGTCRFCENLDLNDGDLLKHHYKTQHKVDPSCMEVVKLLFRADRKAHIYDDTDDDQLVKTKKRLFTSSKVPEKKTIVKVDVGQDSKHALETGLLMYVCKCGVATNKCDSAIEHSQRHLALNYTPVAEICEKCEFEFEVSCLANHLSLHEDTDLSHDDFKVVDYDYTKLISSNWWEMFHDLSQIHKDKIMSSSIYKFTRSVKFRSNSSTGVPVYQCDMCRLCIDPSKVENHCRNYDLCLKNRRGGHNCPECGFNFASEKVLNEHKEDHNIGTMRIVTINNKDDFSFNIALQKAEYNQLSNEDELRDNNQEQIEQTNTPTNLTINDKIMKYCKHCKKYVAISEYEAHKVVHENEHKLNIIRIASELNEGLSIEDSAGANESITKYAEVDKDIDGSNDSSTNKDVRNEDGGGCIETWRSDTDSCPSLTHLVTVVEAQINTSVDNNENDRNSCNARVNINHVNNTVNMNKECINARQHTTETPETLLESMYGVNQTPTRDDNEEMQSTQELLSVLEKQSSQNVINENVATQVRSNESQDMFIDDTIEIDPNSTNVNITDPPNKAPELNVAVKVTKIILIENTGANQVNTLESSHVVDDTGMSLRDKLLRMLPGDDPVELALTLEEERRKKKALVARRMSSKD